MTTTRPSSIAPSVPGGDKIAEKDGTITDDWAVFFENLIRNMQTNFKTQGYVIPPVNNDTFALLTGTASYNNIVYNSDTNELKFNVNGVWKTVQLV